MPMMARDIRMERRQGALLRSQDATGTFPESQKPGRTATLHRAQNSKGYVTGLRIKTAGVMPQEVRFPPMRAVYGPLRFKANQTSLVKYWAVTATKKVVWAGLSRGRLDR